jgi:hypothetical protein
MLSASAFSLASKAGSGFENFSNQVAKAVGWMIGMVVDGSCNRRGGSLMKSKDDF